MDIVEANLVLGRLLLLCALHLFDKGVCFVVL